MATVKHKRKIIARSEDATGWSMTSVTLCGKRNTMKGGVYHQQEHFWKDVDCEICLEFKPEPMTQVIEKGG